MMLPDGTSASVQPPAPAPAPAPAATPPAPPSLDTKPVDPPAPAPVVTPPGDDGKGEVVYEPTGDVGLDMSLAFIGKHGFGPEHPAVKAATAGDFSLIAAELSTKNAVGWEQHIKLGEKAFASVQEKEKANAAAIQAEVQKAAGGEAEWNAIQAWASANASDAEKAEINPLLRKGGLAAKSAVQYLKDAYQRASNVIQEPANVAKPGSGSAASADAPLSRDEYAKAVAELNRTSRGRMEGSPEYAALNNRRLAAIKQGK